MLKHQIKTAYDLRAWHEELQPASLFFSRNNMKFAGDTMANFAVCNASGVHDGQRVELWCLLRRKPVKFGLTGEFYFNKDDFRRMYGVTDVICY